MCVHPYFRHQHPSTISVPSSGHHPSVMAWYLSIPWFTSTHRLQRRPRLGRVEAMSCPVVQAMSLLLFPAPSHRRRRTSPASTSKVLGRVTGHYPLLAQLRPKTWQNSAAILQPGISLIVEAIIIASARLVSCTLRRPNAFPPPARSFDGRNRASLSSSAPTHSHPCPAWQDTHAFPSALDPLCSTQGSWERPCML